MSQGSHEAKRGEGAVRRGPCSSAKPRQRLATLKFFFTVAQIISFARCAESHNNRCIHNDIRFRLATLFALCMAFPERRL
ncbi:hypothetical protein CBM2589_A10141 [Cupriavidus taiwanensis]|uniref:Uncharacterized protein n=1 Tax=Cupriavidus taiwanensis TaxID=164546 RepID=A0A375BYM3_9BURK|nr:hypothetical protein CBM2589_A10141 [Cupriavidus taiwanensis]